MKENNKWNLWDLLLFVFYVFGGFVGVIALIVWLTEFIPSVHETQNDVAALRKYLDLEISNAKFVKRPDEEDKEGEN